MSKIWVIIFTDLQALGNNVVVDSYINSGEFYTFFKRDHPVLWRIVSTVSLPVDGAPSDADESKRSDSSINWQPKYAVTFVSIDESVGGLESG